MDSNRNQLETSNVNITAIRYGATVCPKQFQSERLDIDATLGAGQTAAEAVREAVAFVHNALGAPLPERYETKTAAEPVDTNSAPAKPPAKKTTTRVKRKQAPKPEAPKPHPQVVSAEAMHEAVVTAETPDQLTAAFNTARLHFAEFDDWAEMLQTATEQFQAINASYVKRGEPAPGNDAEWADFIKAMVEEKATMRKAARLAEQAFNQ